MTTILAYDVETAGLVLWDKPSDHPDQPRVTQIACELIDDETRETLAGMHVIIKPDGWTIPEEIQKLTGITMEKASAFGVPMNIVLPTFLGMWQKAEVRVAHNESFDMRMIRIELMRHPDYKDQLLSGTSTSFADYWKAGKAFCTMNASQPILNLPSTTRMRASGRSGPKPPNLGEAYLHFTGKPLEGAHNAMVDVAACKAVYFAIKDHRYNQPSNCSPP